MENFVATPPPPFQSATPLLSCPFEIYFELAMERKLAGWRAAKTAAVEADSKESKKPPPSNVRATFPTFL